MRRTLLHTLLAWLCLISVGLGGAVIRGGVVDCRGGDGESRLEWGCERSDPGEEVAGCECSCVLVGGGAAGTPCPSEPCEDAPVELDGAHPRTGAGAQEIAGLDGGVWCVLAAVPWGDGREVGRAVAVCVGDRPPDTVARLRCVVLVV